jgi:chromosome segregation ATPase
MGEAGNILFPVIAVGVALGGLILTSSRGLRQEMAQMESRLRQEIGHLREDMTRLDERVARLEHGQARLEGLLEGLREAITGRTASS